jgi:menaquinone-9 beta-reductase
MIEKIKTRICIIGAGPAGSTLSILLAQKKIPHVIVDAAEFPRDKICGDGIDLNAIRVLNNIDPSIVENDLKDQTKFSPSQGIRFILANGKYVDLKRKNVNDDHLNKPIFYISKRMDFDNVLVEKLDKDYADIRLGTKIEKIERNEKTRKVYGSNAGKKIEIETELLVGADGDHSIVVKHLGERKIDRKNYAAAVRQYWQGVEGFHPDKLIEVYFPKSLPLSYFWIFPLPNGQANVGYGMASSLVAKKNINVRNAFAGLIKTDPYLRDRFKNATALETTKGWGVPMASRRRKAHGDGWLLVGDAASIVCPTSGEGIGSGMLSAVTAAQFIERAFNQNNFSEKMFNNYDREIHKRLTLEEKFFRFVNYIPGWVFTKGVNAVLSSKIFQNKWSNKEFDRWINTAYKKPIKVNLD